MKKKTIFAFIASVMSAVTIMLPPMQVMAAAQDAAPTEYISEVRIGVGKNMFDASNSLEGYTILRNGEKAVDLNENAGGGFGSKGDRVVLIGYKTTTDRKEAITDLALMNMKGGYSVSDYEALMEKQMKEQIIPFVENFQAAIDEYRENYNSDIEANKQRAKYIHDILDKFIDDDTGKGLGELLLNETKYEMGDAAYNKLSDKAKKNHADILTILAQANGKATLMMENLITRAADTEDTTWLERFAETTYDDLVESSESLPSDAKDELAALYDDDAKTIIRMWNEFKSSLDGYDDAVKTIEKYDEKSVSEIMDEYEAAAKNDFKDFTDEQIKELAEKYTEVSQALTNMTSALQLVALHDQLADIEYLDGNMFDFFTRDIDEMEVEELYPLAASLSDGQKSGLEFISLQELVAIALTTNDGYKDADLSVMKETSIYAGVNRAIYSKGGIALTSDAERQRAALQEQEDSMFSPLSISLMALSGVTFAAFATSSVMYLKTYFTELNPIVYSCKLKANCANMAIGKNVYQWEDFIRAVDSTGGDLPTYQYAYTHTGIYLKLTVGLGVALIILAAVTTYFSWQDMKAYYNVEYSPIPNYIVDEKDITAYNAKGEKVVINNTDAYYEVVGASSNIHSDYYKTFQQYPDLNGAVGKQWLALYVERNANAAPILADSLLAVVGDPDLPSGYTTGIHMFGSDSAFNLNDTKYVYNGSAPQVFVYFNVDDKPASTSTGTSAGTGTNNASVTGSVFTMGNLVLSGGIGLVLGAGIVALIFIAMKPKKKNEE